MTIRQYTLVKKYKEEFLKKENIEEIIEKIEEAKGSLPDRIEIAGGLKEKDDDKIEKAMEVVRDFANQAWYKDSEIQKEFKELDHWRDLFMGEF